MIWFKNSLLHSANFSGSLWWRSLVPYTRWARRAFICSMFCASSLIVGTAAADEKGRGFIPLSAEHIQQVENSWPHIVSVKPNKVGAARIREHLKNSGQPDREISVALSRHEEIVHAIGKVAAESLKSTYLGANALPLPASVDNTALPSFPPIGDQASEGSCVAWGSTYYQATHEIGLLNGINNKSSNANILSPKWTYNLLNGGQDEGLMILDAYTLLSQNGATSIAALPYDGNYLAWDLNPQDWIWAISRRTGPAHMVSGLGGTEAQDLTAIKQLLNNGHVLTIGTFIDSWVMTTVGNDLDNPNSPYAGQKAASWMNGSIGGHCITIVGYNDDIWIDINGNGVVDPGEKGAFLLANSWGADWGNSGLVWVSYDAFLEASAVTGGPNDGRVPLADGLNSSAVSVLPITENYSPSLIAQFTLDQSVRDQISISAGISDTAHSQPTTTFASGALAFSGGNYAFDGNSPGSPEVGTFAIDLSDLLTSVDPSSTARFYLSIADNQQQNPTTLSSFSLIDNVHNNTVVYSNAPITFDNQSINPYIEYAFNPSDMPGVVLPKVSITAPANGEVVQGSLHVLVHATSALGIANVQLEVDGTPFATDTTVPYLFTVDTTQLSDGFHELNVKAYDTENSSSQAVVRVQVNNSSFVPYLPYFPYQTNLHAVITSQFDGDIVQGNVNVDVSVSDNISVNYVEFYVDSKYIGWTGNAPFTFSYDTTQLANGTHEFTVIAYDHLGNTAEYSINVQVNNNAVNNAVSFFAIYVNAGGGQVSYQGISWQEDREAIANSRVASRDLKIANPIYNSERYGNFSYTFNVPNGSYNVKLKFAEMYFTRTNKRVFSVAINGGPVVKDLDLVRAAGFAVPYDLTFPVNVVDGTLNIEFTSTVNLAKVNGIEITQS